MCLNTYFYKWNLENLLNVFQGKPGKDGVPGELGEEVAYYTNRK